MIFSAGWTLAEVDFYWLTTCFSKKICSYEHFHWSFPAQEVYNSENISLSVPEMTGSFGTKVVTDSLG